MTRKLVSLLTALLMLMSLTGSLAESLKMSDVPGMTAAGVLPIVTEPVTLTIGLSPEPNVLDYDTNDFTLWIEEKTGINVEFYFLPTTETSQKVDLMIASNEKLPDIILNGLDSTSLAYYGAQGLFVPMNEYMEKYSYYYDKSLDAMATEADKAIVNQQLYATDGNIYGFPYVRPSINNDHENIFYINTVWLEKLGLEVPTTTEELYNVLVAFRDQDPNGNGLKDEIPLMGYGSGYGANSNRGDVVGNLLNAFLYYPYNTGARLVVKDGVVSSALTADELREGLRFCNKLYKEGLISELSFTQAAEQLKAIIDRPNEEPTVVGMIATNPLSALCGWSGTDANTKVLEYDYMLPLIGPEGVQYAAQNFSGMSFNAAISKDCEHPEVAFRFLDLFCDVEVNATYRFGKLGTDWNWAEEGMKTSTGHDALIYTIGTLRWNDEAQNAIWRKDLQNFTPFGNFDAYQETDNIYLNHVNAIFYGGAGARIGYQPEELFSLPKYTEEEQEVIDEYNAMIWETSNEWRNLFVMGEKNLDTDWQTYLDTLESLGLSEVIEVSQSCYDRMNGK